MDLKGSDLEEAAKQTAQDFEELSQKEFQDFQKSSRVTSCFLQSCYIIYNIFLNIHRS